MAAAETEMVLRVVPFAEAAFWRCGVELGREQEPGQAFFCPARPERAPKIQIGREVTSADLLAHEAGHLVDFVTRVGESECMFGTDVYASTEPGRLRDLVLVAREAFRRESEPLLLRLVAQRLSGALSPAQVRAVLRGRGVRVETVLRRLGVPRDRVEQVFDYAMPFGGFDSWRWLEDTGGSPRRATRVAAAMRLLPQGIPFRLMQESDEVRLRYSRTITETPARQAVHGYFLAAHEVFARMFDQAIRARAAERGFLAGSRRHELDLPEEVFAPIEADFWSLAAERGWL